MNTKFTPELCEILKFYVYVYRDPRNNEPFYVGKGRDDRSFYHLEDDAQCLKVSRIADIRKSKLEPRIEIVRYGLTDEQASLVEASSIDLLGIPPLANEQRGSHGASFGSILSEELIDMHAAKPATITHKTVLFTISRLYRSGMSAEELYEATRAAWTIGPRRRQEGRVELAMAVFRGIVKEVYRIERWLPARSLRYKTRDYLDFDPKKWAFEGAVAPEQIRDQYRGLSVRRYLGKAQNPVHFENC